MDSPSPPPPAARRRAGPGRRGCLSVLAVAAMIALILIATPSGRAHGRAALLVADLLSPTRQSVLRGLPSPLRQPVSIPTAAGETEANFYLPAGAGPHGALILVLGFPSDIEDQALNQVAANLARLGVAVLIPRLPRLRVGELAASDVEILIAAFEWLAAQPSIAPGHIGYGGFCVGSSLALLAAEDERIRERVALVNVFGGYYDLPGYIRAIAARSAEYSGREYPWRPAADTDTLLAKNVLAYLDSPSDAAALRAHLTGDNATPPALSAAGRWALALLSAGEPQAVDALMAQLPAGYDVRLRAMSPSAGIDRLRARLYIMHDLSDPFVPVVEAYRLRAAAPEPAHARFAEFVLFQHVRPAPGRQRLIVIREAGRLIFFLAPLLAELEPE